MPSFNTHWLVAMKCIKDGGLPKSIVAGYKKYKDETLSFKDALSDKISKINSNDTLYAFLKTNGGLDNALRKYNEKLADSKNYNDITCFSAYMLGACGPDFWTVTSPGINTASMHFDLGHYNRTHCQFQVAIERWKKNQKNNFQTEVEQAYFYGMATHIATDCVIHQLVNVSAGAYNLLESKWSNEQGAASHAVRQWNTHNKVENYWDSYIRYRYIGDTGHLFNATNSSPLDDGNWMTVLNFPTTESIISDLQTKIVADRANLQKTYDITNIYQNRNVIRERLINELRKDAIKIKIEKPFILPRIFCDRILVRGDIKPFIYDIVVDKKNGAYPGAIKKDKTLEGIVFKKAIIESESLQMKPVAGSKTPQTGYNEGHKLNYFSSQVNENVDINSFNYLNYYVCPNLERVRLYGWDVFYHLNALGPFTDSAMKAGKEFIGCLSAGTNVNNPDKIGMLGKFWNLDTGLGLEARQVSSDTPNEVITELNFVHINKDVTTQVDYKKNNHYLGHIKPTKKPYPETAEITAFDTGAEPNTPHNKSIKSVEEANSDKYLSTIALKPKDPTPYPTSRINGFFVDQKEVKTKPMHAKTASQTPITPIQAHDIKHRLNLLITAPIADFSPRGRLDNLGFELRGDGTGAINDMKPAEETETKKWLKKSNAIVRINAHSKVRSKPGRFERSDTGMCIFHTRLFLNLEKSKELKRETRKGIWNNVIEYDKHDTQYSRNYSIGTSRRNVLNPVNWGKFDANTHFARYVDISPTEQVFFSIYLLTKSQNEWYDMLSKKTVSKNQFEKLIRIESLGFVKIVLFYELTRNGGAQLTDCYIDGLKVPVV